MDAAWRYADKSVGQIGLKSYTRLGNDTPIEMTEAPNQPVAALKQHRLFRIAAVYAVVGWSLIQVADIVLEAFESPAWVMQTLLIVILAGFPVTLAAIWVVERGRQSRPAKGVAPVATILLAFLMSIGAYHYFMSDDSPRDTQPPAVQQGRTSNPVLAVLPFANMSSLAENEYLADGMTEDVITLLAQSPGVEVIARNSTFKYKDQNPDIRDVGRDLGADYVIEGSIRQLGERIRVTVQVINAKSGAHIWAEKYDRPQSEFFDIQDEVSLGVAAAVGDAVFKKEYSEINQSRTDNLTAWALISQAEIAHAHQGSGGDDATSKARQAVALDPEYALAHAVLGRSLALKWFNDRDAELAREAESAARLAAKIDPDDPKVLAYLAHTLLVTGHPAEALPYAERVARISPSYAEGLIYYADILIHNGRSRESLPYFEKGIRLTPNAPQLAWYHWLYAEALAHHGNFADAETSLITANRMFQGGDQVLLRLLAGVQLQLGKVDEARARLAEADLIDGRPLSEEKNMWAMFSTDDGGEHIKGIFVDLEHLSGSDNQ